MQDSLNMQDPEWINKLKAGDREAFRQLVEVFQVKVINLGNAYLHDTQEAEDIAQDVFLEVFDAIHKFRGDASLSTWIYRITVNKAINRRKKLKRKAMFSFGFQSPGEKRVPENHASITDQADFPLLNEEDKQALHQAIDQLPGMQKDAFLLSKYEQLSYKEIADVLNTSLPSVESLLFRAKSNLRKSLSVYIRDH